MNETEAVEFLAAANNYTPAEAAAELDSLRTGDWDSLQVSDAEGTAYHVEYNPETDGFTVTDNYR